MYLMCSVAVPAGSSLSTVNVAISFFSSVETLAVCVCPPEVTVTSWKSISSAFSVMVLLGLASVTSMDSSPSKLLVGKSILNDRL